MELSSVFDAVAWPLLAFYALNVALMGAYGLHMLWLTCVFVRRRRLSPGPAPSPEAAFGEAPVVTVQLPLYNEAEVAERVIRAACALDWPADRLEVQVLDDSTDPHDRTVVDRAVRALRAEGHDVSLVRRTNREGYKAGALAHGMTTAKGEFLAIFDADFVPRPDFLRKTIGRFRDPLVGMVQGRWEHINAEASLLTRCQEMALDGHFVIEQISRSRSGWLFNFNGTAGVWRASCIDDAGGWTQRTLSEDLDLSYRAQLRGWTFLYDGDVGVPAELPGDMRAFKVQQRRWNKGTMECCKLLLGPVWRSDLPFWSKIEGTIHLGRPILQLWLVAMVILAFPVSLTPALQWRGDAWAWTAALAIGLWLICTISTSVFYLVAARALGKSGWRAAALMPALMSMAVGISLSNAWAVAEALAGKASAFVRTPKAGVGAPRAPGDPAPPERRAPPTFGIARRMDALATIEVAIALYLAVCIGAALHGDIAEQCVPFMALFGLGFTWSAAGSVWAGRAES